MVSFLSYQIMQASDFDQKKIIQNCEENINIKSNQAVKYFGIDLNI